MDFFYPPPFMICRFISCVSVYLSVQFNLLPIEEVKSMRPSHLVIFGLAGKKRKCKKKTKVIISLSPIAALGSHEKCCERKTVGEKTYTLIEAGGDVPDHCKGRFIL